MRFISEDEQMKLVEHAIEPRLLRLGLSAVEIDPSTFFDLFNKKRDPFGYIYGLYSNVDTPGQVRHYKICGLVGVLAERLAIGRAHDVGGIRHEILHDVYTQLGLELKTSIEVALEQDGIVAYGEFKNSFEALGMRAIAGLRFTPSQFATEFISSYFGCFSDPLWPKEKRMDYTNCLQGFAAAWPRQFKDTLREIGFKVDTYVPFYSK